MHLKRTLLAEVVSATTWSKAGWLPIEVAPCYEEAFQNPADIIALKILQQQHLCCSQATLPEFRESHVEL